MEPADGGMDGPEHINTEEARAGSTPRMTRYILGWSTALVVVIFAALLIYWL
jgi:hypothetical protein